MVLEPNCRKPLMVPMPKTPESAQKKELWSPLGFGDCHQSYWQVDQAPHQESSSHCPVREWAVLGFLGRWVEGNRGTQKASISISIEESGVEVIFMKEVCRTKLRVAVFCQRKMDVRTPH